MSAPVVIMVAVVATFWLMAGIAKFSAMRGWKKAAAEWEATAGQWTALAEDVFDTTRLTRDLLTRLDGTLDVRDELVAREMQVQELQDRIVELQSPLEGAPVSFGGGAG